MLTRLLRFINEQHGRAFAPLGRYPAGEQGAFAIVEGSGQDARRFVLKWSPESGVPDDLQAAMAVTSRLRSVGYPAPSYRLVGYAPRLGVAYSVQEALPGAPMGRRLVGPILDRLLELNGLQRGQALVASDDWPRPVADPVLYGGAGFCLHDSLRTFSAQTAELLSTLQRLVAASAGSGRRGDDVVHFDFQASNILVDRAAVSGVVDWEGCCAGDRAFDLATLYFYAGDEPGAASRQRERLWRLLCTVTETPLLRVYLAHLILRQVDWSIRFHDRATVERFLALADDVLRRLATLGGGSRDAGADDGRSGHARE
jgi:hypothetical protein